MPFIAGQQPVPQQTSPQAPQPQPSPGGMNPQSFSPMQPRFGMQGGGRPMSRFGPMDIGPRQPQYGGGGYGGQQRQPYNPYGGGRGGGGGYSNPYASPYGKYMASPGSVSSYGGERGGIPQMGPSASPFTSMMQGPATSSSYGGETGGVPQSGPQAPSPSPQSPQTPPGIDPSQMGGFVSPSQAGGNPWDRDVIRAQDDGSLQRVPGGGNPQPMHDSFQRSIQNMLFQNPYRQQGPVRSTGAQDPRISANPWGGGPAAAWNRYGGNQQRYQPQGDPNEIIWN